MIARIRIPGSEPRDRDLGPGVARYHGTRFYVGGSLTIGESGNETIRQAKPLSDDPRAVQVREAARRYRARRAGL